MSAENKAIVRRYFEAIDTGNLAALDELFAPTYVRHDPNAPEVKGREDLKRHLRMVYTASPDLCHTHRGHACRRGQSGNSHDRLWHADRGPDGDCAYGEADHRDRDEHLPYRERQDSGRLAQFGRPWPALTARRCSQIEQTSFLPHLTDR